MYEYDEDDEGGRSRGRVIAIAVAVVALALIGWFGIKPRFDDEGNAGGGSVIPGDAGSSTTVAGDGSAAPSGSAADAPTTAEEATSESLKAEKPVTSGEPATTAGSTTTAASTTTTAPPTTAAGAPYATLPNGEPEWVVATYDEHSITLDGAVPDQAAKDRLQGLAIANAKPGQADSVVNNLTINPAMPRNVGVRVVELTSERFPEGSAEVLPPQAAELDRVVNVMNALPHITALVIGHADQRGSDVTNYALSEQRALAVKNYVTAAGIAADRLSSRAVGEADLLTLNDDEDALALNRRTEFVFYGLLLG